MLRAADRSAPVDEVTETVSSIARPPRGWRRPAELFLTGRAAVAAGRVPAGLVEAITPYAAEWVLLGTAAATLGPMSGVLADLAVVAGDQQMATVWHTQATDACVAMGSRWWAEEVARR